MAADKHEQTALDEVLALLEMLRPVQRARWLGALLDRRNAPTFTAMRVAAIHGETRSRTYNEVAAELGVSWNAVQSAVKAHNARLVASGPDATESTQTDAAQAAQREEQQ